MQALVLNGFIETTPLSEQLQETLGAELAEQGYEVASLCAAHLRIAPCRGCFDCWLRTPGKCCYRDDFETVARAYLHSDVAIFWTPVVFGTYSSGMKRILERMIGLMTPFFRFENGETHHPPRYSTSPALFGLGWLTAPDPGWADLFTRLVARNAANLLSPHYGAAVIRNAADWAEAGPTLRTFLHKLREER